MNIYRNPVRWLLTWLLPVCCSFSVAGQPLPAKVSGPGSDPFRITVVESAAGASYRLPVGLPLFTVLADSVFEDGGRDAHLQRDTLFFSLGDSLVGTAVANISSEGAFRYTIRFANPGSTARTLENLVPLGESPDRAYITAGGSKEWPGYLCRSRLHRPGFGPVGVVLPDNAWHLGFCSLPVDSSLSLTALARRGSRDTERTSIDRWKVTLKPGGWVEYNAWFILHDGDWRDGLKVMFRDHWLFDMPAFDSTLFRRSDLAWMKSKYIMLLQFAWDRKYYDYASQKHTFFSSFFEYDTLTGGYDIFTLWPTWPRLGLDRRNQWDMYRDLPGGIAGLRDQADFLHRHGRKFFISYNPWDEGTRKEDQLTGMEELLRATGADGVVLDTRGSSSRELQAAADHVKPGIIMYSEGMAVPRDMPGIVSGRVHDALVMPPPINLNKLIKPDFAIFRVLQLADDRLHRELAIAFFNGYGVEINTMRPGRPAWIPEEFAFMGRTTRILRENTSMFSGLSFDPLIPTLTDSVYVNGWTGSGKKVFTVFSLKPQGYSGPLIEWPESGPGWHLVDLWNHEETEVVERNGRKLVPVTLKSFDPSWLQTRREGETGCMALFREVLSVRMERGILEFSCPESSVDKILVWSGNPSYCSEAMNFTAGGGKVEPGKWRQGTAGKVVVQAFAGDELVDERIVHYNPGAPLLVSHPGKAVVKPATGEGMVRVTGGPYRYQPRRDPTAAEPFIPFPDYGDTLRIVMPDYYMDKYPVTNAQYKKFIDQTFYNPSDTNNYLKHWLNDSPVPGTEDLPVVYVSQGDAAAFAAWAGKRLPTEMEWQYAAQGSDLRKYPWGDRMDSTRCNYNLDRPTPVTEFPGGASPFGVMDLVGNVWQLTADVYNNGSYYFNIIRGGSHYHPTQSIWYVTGGPKPVDHPEMLLLISPGLDRNSTVGFRCMADAE